MLVAALALGANAAAEPGGGASGERDHRWIRGVTISCQTWGFEWGTPGFARELDRLADLGVNWVAIHPYAGIGADGSVRWSRGPRTELLRGPDDAPPWLRAPIQVAHERGFSILIKPHLAYWGSPFSWRGEIEFEEPEARARFWREYGDWIVGLARVTRDADAFCVGTELDGMLADTDEWRALVARVREATDARLTYAANWDGFDDVGFWDDLDAVGVQAYFPLSEAAAPSDADLARGWDRVLASLRAVHERTGKPVVFTELGYDASLAAAREPWASGRGMGHGFHRDGAPRTAAERELQERLLGAALDVLTEEREWLRGAFLWKWFVGRPGRGDHSFYLDTQPLRDVLRGAWGAR